jgi:hypothetical protein
VLAFNRGGVQHFYSNAETVISKLKLPPTRIYNVDETEITTVQSPSRITGPKGIKQIGALTGWGRGKNISVCCSFSAASHCIPPMVVFPRKRMSPHLEQGGPSSAIYHYSPNGWMATELFTEWLKHIAAQTNASIQNSVLLVMDNHSSHTLLLSHLF